MLRIRNLRPRHDLEVHGHAHSGHGSLAGRFAAFRLAVRPRPAPKCLVLLAQALVLSLQVPQLGLRGDVEALLSPNLRDDGSHDEARQHALEPEPPTVGVRPTKWSHLEGTRTSATTISRLSLFRILLNARSWDAQLAEGQILTLLRGRAGVLHRVDHQLLLVPVPVNLQQLAAEVYSSMGRLVHAGILRVVVVWLGPGLEVDARTALDIRGLDQCYPQDCLVLRDTLAETPVI
mmetsp:Transcript_102133/g.264102  ORF Transcript_102133/g.264102 Transcript_102133/m.264102 type:complete len:234 (-) Transcript_102133:127-828(-)